MGYIDYEYVEVEGGLVGIIFSNEIEEFCVELLYKFMVGWCGGISFYYKGSDVFV